MEKLVYDTPEKVLEKMNRIRKGFNSHKTKDVSFRIKQLKILRASISKYEKEIDIANNKDLGQSPFFSFFGSTSGLLNELDHIISHCQEWSSPRATETPIAFAPSSSYIVPEPYGTVLIMGAWNFNFALSIVPLATAIAAGNVCLVKPSEMAPYSAFVIQQMCEELDQDIVQVCHGERETCEALLGNKFDFIFFTGSPMKGKLVAKAAAEFLTPNILELGGQNPCIVDKSASIYNAAMNLTSGRFMNSGQVCLCPEYVFVEFSMIDTLVEEMKKCVSNFFGGEPKKSEDYSRVINEWHAKRLSDLVTNPGKGAKKIIGGDFDIAQRYIEPSIFRFDNFDDMRNSSLAKEEIFGPIMYLVPYKKIDDVIDYINSRDKPLALYYFGNDKTNKELLISRTSSGAIVTNDVIVHYTNSYLPFGGVGTSGYGAYHGQWGFDALSHLKPVMDRGQGVLGLRYPPFAPNAGKLRFLLRNLNFTQTTFIKGLLLFAALVLIFVFRNNLCCLGSNIYNRLTV